MTLSDLAAIGSFISGVAVFVTFVFLTVQIRQNTRNQRSIMQQGRAMRNVELSIQFADPKLASIYQRGGIGDTSLDVGEVAAFRRAFVASLLSFEDGFLQRRMGMLEAPSASGDLSILKTVFSQPGFRAMWLMLRPSFGAEYAAYLDRVLEETPVVQPPDIAETWRSLVAQEKAKIAPAGEAR